MQCLHAINSLPDHNTRNIWNIRNIWDIRNIRNIWNILNILNIRNIRHIRNFRNIWNIRNFSLVKATKEKVVKNTQEVPIFITPAATTTTNSYNFQQLLITKS